MCLGLVPLALIACRRAGVTEGEYFFSTGGRVMTGIAGSTDIGECLKRITTGDRDAAARFVMLYAPVIRQRFRARLSPALRRLMDSTDLVSTIGRRLDQIVASGALDLENESQLWALVNHLARAAIADKARVLARLRRVEEQDSGWARGFLERAERQGEAARDPFDDTLDRAMRTVESETDQRVLALWLAGCSHVQISAQLDMTPAAVRQRWQRVRALLAEEFAGRTPEGVP